MSTEENKAIVRRWFEDVINEKRLDGAADHVAQDNVDHGALPGQAPGLEGAKRKVGDVRCRISRSAYLERGHGRRT